MRLRSAIAQGGSPAARGKRSVFLQRQDSPPIITPNYYSCQCETDLHKSY
ncbi:hypothetical protein [Oceanobacillus chungangensis]|nr:hypothetical protein [Oceanobacillus chungangensis]